MANTGSSASIAAGNSVLVVAALNDRAEVLLEGSAGHESGPLSQRLMNKHYGCAPDLCFMK